MPSIQSSPKDIEAYAIRALKKWLKKAMSYPEVRKRLVALEAKTYQVDLSVVGDARMEKINFAFRKVKKTTDILSFPTHEFFQHQGVLGDLVLSGPVALRQAKELGHSWKKEIDVLLVHGILHLLHFDHETGEKDAKNMASWEAKILGKSVVHSLISRAGGNKPAAKPKARVTQESSLKIAKKKATRRLKKPLAKG